MDYEWCKALLSIRFVRQTFTKAHAVWDPDPVLYLCEYSVPHLHFATPSKGDPCHFCVNP